MKIIKCLILIHFILLSSISQAAGSICSNFFRNEAAIQIVKKELHEDLRDPETAVAKMQISLKGFEVVQYLAEGSEGFVYLLQKDGKKYVLKIARDWIDDMSQAIIIQKHLSRLGFAPPVVGSVSKKEIESFGYKFKSYKEATLMEYIPEHFFKNIQEEHLKANYSNVVKISALQKQRLFQQAVRMQKVISQLGLTMVDVDAYINHEGRLQLIDFGMYEVVTPYTDPARHEFQMGNARYNLKMFIEDYTEVIEE